MRVADTQGGRACLTPDATNWNKASVHAVPDSGWSTLSVEPDTWTLDISSDDAEATVTFEKIPAPGAPTNVTAIGVEERATLKWNAPSGDPTPTGYEVTKDGWKTKVTLGSGVYEYTFTNLAPGQYTLSVRAVNSGAQGPEVRILEPNKRD